MIVRLNDGTALLVRPIRPTDKSRLAAGLDHLSERSRERRFLGPKPRLARRELRYLTEVDRHDHYAIVALAPGTDYIVAAARYVRDREDRSAAEAAVVVMDNLQGKGLGKQLARMLADAALENGIREIHATMLSDNLPALALMRVISACLRDGGHHMGQHEVVAELAA
jgi:RimJ/RimL family protein N-acetyltransferase